MKRGILPAVQRPDNWPGLDIGTLEPWQDFPRTILIGAMANQSLTYCCWNGMTLDDLVLSGL